MTVPAPDPTDPIDPIDPIDPNRTVDPTDRTEPADATVFAGELVAGFAAALRAEGLEVPLRSMLLYVQALGLVGFADRHDLYWAGRATLVVRPTDAAAYDRAFAAYWDIERSSSSPDDTPVGLRVLDTPDQESDDDLPAEDVLADDSAGDSADGESPDDGPDEGPDDGPDPLAVRYSAVEVLRRQDFARCSRDELDELRRLMADLRLVAPTRRSHRRVSGRRGRGRIDLRRTTRSALRTGGEVVHLHRTKPGRRPRRVVLLCDISGSMAPYARALLQFAHAATAGGRVEAFTIGTQLTRVTRELAGQDPDVALERAAAAVTDWSGGTRLGDALCTFNDRWGARGMARGAVVVILSDGWDRGDPATIAAQMARLHRLAHRVIWVNPLKASDGYAPLAAGMAAALPHVDDFVEGHDLVSLEALATRILQGSAPAGAAR